VTLLYSNLDMFVGIEDIECLIDDEGEFSWLMYVICVLFY
jgi:hypothetical protein